MGYTVLQPVTSFIFTLTILYVLHLLPECQQLDVEDQHTICLHKPGNIGTLCGIVGVAFGLSLIVMTEPKKSIATTTATTTMSPSTNGTSDN